MSRLEKPFWTAADFTKRDMLRYYLRIIPIALPHFRVRPVTLRVFPEGTEGISYYQRERPEYGPAWLRALTRR